MTGLVCMDLALALEEKKKWVIMEIFNHGG